MTPQTGRPAKFTPIGQQANSAYGHCGGCGSVILAEVAGTSERRRYCTVCAEKVGKSPDFMVDLAAKKRPPYELR